MDDINAGNVLREEANLTARIEKIENQLANLRDSEIELARLYATVRTALDIPEDVADVDNAVTEYSAYVAGKITNLTTRRRANEEACDKIKATLETIRKTGPDGTCPICLQPLGEHFADVEREYVARIAEMMVEGDDLDKEVDKALGETHRVPNLKPTLDRIRTIQIGLGYRDLYENDLKELRAKLNTIRYPFTYQ